MWISTPPAQIKSNLSQMSIVSLQIQIQMYNLFADLSEKTKDSVTPYIIVNLSNDQYLEFPENHVVAFTEKDDTEGEVFEIEQVDITPRNLIPA